MFPLRSWPHMGSRDHTYLLHFSFWFIHITDSSRFSIRSQWGKFCELSSLENIFQSFSHFDNLDKLLSHHAQHSFIVLSLLSMNEHFSDLTFVHWRLNSCGLFSPTKSVLSIIFCILLFDLLQVVAIWNIFYVVSKSFRESLCECIPSFPLFQLLWCKPLQSFSI